MLWMLKLLLLFRLLLLLEVLRGRRLRRAGRG